MVAAKKEVKKVGEKLKGSVIEPFMHEFLLKDVLEVIIGAAILAIPVGFTEETWKLGESLPMANVIGFMMASLLFIAAFVYYNYFYHKHHSFSKHPVEFFKRVGSTYVLSFIVVSILLTLIDKAPWGTDALLAFKRVVLVTFPASMSGTIADVIK